MLSILCMFCKIKTIKNYCLSLTRCDCSWNRLLLLDEISDFNYYCIIQPGQGRAVRKSHDKKSAVLGGGEVWQKVDNIFLSPVLVFIFNLTLHSAPSQPDKSICLLAGWLENFPNYISNLVFVIIPGYTQLMVVVRYEECFNIFSWSGSGRPGLMGSLRYLITGGSSSSWQDRLTIHYDRHWEMINSSELKWQFVFILSGHHGQTLLHQIWSQISPVWFWSTLKIH